jgi:hypothetical protein
MRDGLARRRGVMVCGVRMSARLASCARENEYLVRDLSYGNLTFLHNTRSRSGALQKSRQSSQLRLRELMARSANRRRLLRHISHARCAFRRWCFRDSGTSIGWWCGSERDLGRRSGRFGLDRDRCGTCDVSHRGGIRGFPRYSIWIGLIQFCSLCTTYTSPG